MELTTPQKMAVEIPKRWWKAVVEGRVLIIKKGPAATSWKEYALEVAELLRKLHNQHTPFSQKLT